MKEFSNAFDLNTDVTYNHNIDVHSSYSLCEFKLKGKWFIWTRSNWKIDGKQTNEHFLLIECVGKNKICFS